MCALAHVCSVRVCSVRVCSVRVLVCARYMFVSVHQTGNSMVYFMIPPLHCQLTVTRLYPASADGDKTVPLCQLMVTRLYPCVS